MAYCEPRYREASKALSEGKFRRALELISQVSAKKPSYKDAMKLKMKFSKEVSLVF